MLLSPSVKSPFPAGDHCSSSSCKALHLKSASTTLFLWTHTKKYLIFWWDTERQRLSVHCGKMCVALMLGMFWLGPGESDYLIFHSAVWEALIIPLNRDSFIVLCVRVLITHITLLLTKDLCTRMSNLTSRNLYSWAFLHSSYDQNVPSQKSSGQNLLANKVISLLFTLSFFWCLTGFGKYEDKSGLRGLNCRTKTWNSSSLLTLETNTAKQIFNSVNKHQFRTVVWKIVYMQNVLPYGF